MRGGQTRGQDGDRALEHGGGRLLRLHGIRPEQIAVVYNGVDCQRFSPAHRSSYRAIVRRELGVDDQTLLLFLAAHNFRLKGVPELLALRRGWSRMAGRCTWRSPAASAWRNGGVRPRSWAWPGRASFVGTVANLVPYYAAADAYVHPTYYDPCSLVLLEAAASGLPIVTTRRYNGAVELFREDDEILTADDPAASDALYERVDALFDERLRAQTKCCCATSRAAQPNRAQRRRDSATV